MKAVIIGLVSIVATNGAGFVEPNLKKTTSILGIFLDAARYSSIWRLVGGDKWALVY